MKNPRAVFLVLALTALAVCVVFVPVERLLVEMHRWAGAHPNLAVWIVGAAFFLGVILLVPVSPIVMLAGFLFGLAKGFALIWLTGMLASSLAFWIGRTSARTWVERKLKDKTIFLAIDRAIERNGFWIVLLSRLAMVFPYGPLNYSLGLSSLRFSHYLLGTSLGMILPFILVVYLGSTVSSVAAVLSGEVQLPGQSLVVGLVILATVILIAVIIVRSALRVLREELS